MILERSPLPSWRRWHESKCSGNVEKLSVILSGMAGLLFSFKDWIFWFWCKERATSIIIHAQKKITNHLTSFYTYTWSCLQQNLTTLLVSKINQMFSKLTDLCTICQFMSTKQFYNRKLYKIMVFVVLDTSVYHNESDGSHWYWTLSC